MDPYARALIGGLALFILWRLVRAARTGVIYSEGYAFDSGEAPMLYAFGYLAHVVCAAMCLGFAAGYTPAEEKQFVWMLMSGR